MKETEIIYPLTIVFDRYSGVYSGGKFTAWNLEPNEIPKSISSNDCECASFWTNYSGIVGKGNTPQEAYNDLNHKLSDVPKLIDKLFAENLFWYVLGSLISADNNYTNENRQNNIKELKLLLSQLDESSIDNKNEVRKSLENSISLLNNEIKTKDAIQFQCRIDNQTSNLMD